MQDAEMLDLIDYSAGEFSQAIGILQLWVECRAEVLTKISICFIVLEMRKHFVVVTLQKRR